ncbi:hypothetical protein DSUL_50369 [Desulfovibrionales bacterium]
MLKNPTNFKILAGIHERINHGETFADAYAETLSEPTETTHARRVPLWLRLRLIRNLTLLMHTGVDRVPFMTIAGEAIGGNATVYKTPPEHPIAQHP